MPAKNFDDERRKEELKSTLQGEKKAHGKEYIGLEKASGSFREPSRRLPYTVITRCESVRTRGRPSF